MPQETVENQNSNQEELKILITGDKPKNLLAGNLPAALAYSRNAAGVFLAAHLFCLSAVARFF